MSPDPLDAQLIATRPFLITFSGIDGAGKTTQIECLSLSLQKQGLRVLRLSFWDDVAVWSKVRAGVGHGSQESGHADPTAERPFAPRNNKHIRKWYLSAARAGLYLLDVARLRRLLASQPAKGSDVVIFDRYIYDQIANIYSQSFAARSYAKILLKQRPLPTWRSFWTRRPPQLLPGSRNILWNSCTRIGRIFCFSERTGSAADRHFLMQAGGREK
jgi:thymidylate kinase